LRLSAIRCRYVSNELKSTVDVHVTKLHLELEPFTSYDVHGDRNYKCIVLVFVCTAYMTIILHT
jgi:hypothetical protein